MHELPRETLTFLFTDIEGSTRLWEQSPAEAGSALARHDALMRMVIEQNDGKVFKTVGDAFCAAFRTAAHAVAAARAAQLALAQEPWPKSAHIKVRMALHTGAAEARDNDYFGQTLNRVARLLSAGHGEQVLLSRATQELVRDSLPVGVALRDLGDCQLKDLVRPERVYQIIAPGMTADFPPLKTLDARAHNLPIQSTSLVGREREMQEVKDQLKSSRLVTLTGTGGAGKTRLSLRVGADRIDDFADGVWFVELAALTDAVLVPQAVATVLRIKEQPGTAIIDTLIKELKNKELLLILDNCEHLVDASALLCQSLLSVCAAVRILASSREALRVPGEAAYRVPSLSTPDPKAPIRVEALRQYPAVQLFIERAVAVQSSFAVNNANAQAIASICHCLDGIPLALELAAARVRALSVEEINQRLDQRFRLLTGGSRTALPRQQTLRALIDWSYDLLTTAEQALLCRLSVFSGGWTLDAAEQVCSGEEVGTVELLDLLTALIDKSLVVAEERNGVSRYRLLQTVRQYAWELILESDQGAPLRDRHLVYFLSLSEEAEPQLRGADQQAWLDRLETEHDNLRSALTWSLAVAGNNVAGLRLAGTLFRFWHMSGHLGEGRDWLNRLLAAAPGGPTAVRAKALNGAGIMASRQEDHPAARSLHEESLSIRRELGDRHGVAVSLNSLGNVTFEQNDYQSARGLYEESLGIFREFGDQWGIADSLNSLGNVTFEQSDYQSARGLYEESIAISRELDDRWGLGVVLLNQGLVACCQGDSADAMAMYEESLAIFWELGARWLIAESLEGIAYVALTLTGAGRSARIWGGAERLREEIGSPMPSDERSRYHKQVAAARAALGDDAAFDLAWQEGRALTLEQAVDYALEKQDA